MFSKLHEIAAGFKNFMFENKDVEAEAFAKAQICASCEYSKQLSIEVIKEDRIDQIKSLSCSVCKCPLSTKLRSPKSKCPKLKF